MESLKIVNERLKSTFGRFEDGRANYKIVFAADEREIRLDEKSGHYIEQWKYTTHRDCWVLERLIPVAGNIELITKTSYEPIWFYYDKNQKPLPYDWDITLIVIEALHKAAAGSIGVKYKDPDAGLTTEDQIEKRKLEIDTLVEDLFGNETNVSDALAYHDGVSVPSNYEVKNNG